MTENLFEDDMAMGEYIEEVLMEVLGKYNSNSKGFQASCPVCREGSSFGKKKRFQYYTKTLSAYCFNTGCPLNHSPSRINLVRVLRDSDMQTENARYAKWYMAHYGKGISSFKAIEPDRHDEDPIEAKENASEANEGLFEDDWVDLPPTVRNYCEERKMFSAPFAPNDWNFYFDRKTKRLVIPWKNNGSGRIEYWQKRALLKGASPKYLYPVGLSKSDFVFNLEKIDESWPFILMTEGCIDATFSYNTVAIGGIKPSESQLTMIRERYPKHKLVVMIDNPWVDWSARIALLGDWHEGTRGMIDQHKFDRMFFVWDRNCPYKDINECACAAPGVYPFESRSWLQTKIMSAMQAKLMMNFKG